MTFSLRSRRLRCFYCGNLSAQKQNGVTLQFKCEHCEAINYLDKNGKITDPPTSASLEDSPAAAPPPMRFARAATSPPRDQASSIFCQTCLKNQHMYRENLAAYLPPESSPDYSKYVASLDVYKARLESRYPQICAECAPAAREAIKRAGYMAKTDHLRRMMDQSRSQFPTQTRAGWRNAFLAAAGFCSYSCSLAQFSWHLGGFMSANYRMSYDVSDIPHPFTSSTCLKMASSGSIHPWCTQTLELWMPLVIYGSAITFWWNNKLRVRYVNRTGRLTGLLEALFLQIIAFAIRCSAWGVTTTYNIISAKPETVQGVHLFMMVFIPLMVLLSNNCVKIDTTPRVKFQAQDADILPDVPPPTSPSRQPPEASAFGNARSYPLSVVSKRPASAFPIAALSTTPTHSPRAAPAALHASLTPEVDSDPDAMDWTPSHTPAPIHLTPRRPQPVPTNPQQPSPFYGSIPPAPSSMQHPRQPKTAPVIPFRKAKPDTNPFLSFSRAPAAAADDDADSDAEPELDAEPKGPARRRSSAGFTLQPARFFAPADRGRMETGLESMFDEVFRLRDEPAEVGAQASSDAAVQRGVQGSPPRKGVFDVDPLVSEPVRRSRAMAVLVWVLVALVPVAILGGAALAVRAWNYEIGAERLLRETFAKRAEGV